jgi:RimJ/RimL family protein N-acetyltransferase
MVLLNTDRLQLRHISLADAPFYVKLFNSKDWLKYIGDRKVKSVTAAEAYIQKNYLPAYQKHGYGSYVVQLKATEEIIGTVGLYRRENLEHPDIGFAFLEAYQGKGYGYEAASALMIHGKTHFDISTVLGFTMRENVASIFLLKKLGLQEVGVYQFENDPEELLLFSN